MQNILNDKIQSLLEESGIETLTPAAKNFVMEQLGEQIFQRILIQMTQDLPEEKLSAFLEFIENNNSNESIEVFLGAVYPDLEDVMEEKTKEVMEEYMQASRAVTT